MKPRGYPAKKRDAPEKREQTKIRNLLGLLNAAVYDTSQPFQPFITPGVPDIVAFLWVPDGEGYRYAQFAIECKAPGEKPTPAQREYLARARAAGSLAMAGDAEAFRAFLLEIGVAVRIRGEWTLLGRVATYNRQHPVPELLG